MNTQKTSLKSTEIIKSQRSQKKKKQILCHFPMQHVIKHDKDMPWQYNANVHSMKEKKNNTSLSHVDVLLNLFHFVCLIRQFFYIYCVVSVFFVVVVLLLILINIMYIAIIIIMYCLQIENGTQILLPLIWDIPMLFVGCFDDKSNQQQRHLSEKMRNNLCNNTKV